MVKNEWYAEIPSRVGSTNFNPHFIIVECSAFNDPECDSTGIENNASSKKLEIKEFKIWKKLSCAVIKRRIRIKYRCEQRNI